jgi:predicted alpha/beta-hydrolase family hydrolase
MTADTGPSTAGGTNNNPTAPKVGGRHGQATAKNLSALLSRSFPSFNLGYPKRTRSLPALRNPALLAAGASALAGIVYGLSTLFG